MPGPCRRFSVETESHGQPIIDRKDPNRKVLRAGAEARQGCLTLEYNLTPQYNPHCLFRIAVKYENKFGNYQFMQWAIESRRLRMETNIVASRVRYIPMPYSIHSRAWQRGQPQQPSCYYFTNTI